MTGCATTPKWVTQTPNADFYYVGVGSGRTFNAAEVNALLDMSAFVNGTELDAVVDFFRREHGITDQTALTEDFKQQIRQYTNSTIPPDVQIAERWQSKEGKWALALGIRPNMTKRANEMHELHIQRAKVRAFVPGLAQLERRHNRRAAAYISGFILGLAGGASMASLNAGAIENRDRSRTQVDYDYYDDRANTFYWVSNSLYGLAAVSYLGSFIDGWYLQLKPYQHLTQNDVDISGANIVVKF